MTKTEQLDKLVRDGEERLLLARALDKLETGARTSRRPPAFYPHRSGSVWKT